MLAVLVELAVSVLAAELAVSVLAVLIVFLADQSFSFLLTQTRSVLRAKRVYNSGVAFPFHTSPGMLGRILRPRLRAGAHHRPHIPDLR